jgi:hypothetical protein
MRWQNGMRDLPRLPELCGIVAEAEPQRREMVTMQNRNIRLCLCDFGFGIQRYDIDKISFLEQISEDGSYTGLSLAADFDFSTKSFSRLDWTRKVKKFLGWN